jgi:hypothetical protein
MVDREVTVNKVVQRKDGQLRELKGGIFSVVKVCTVKWGNFDRFLG